VRLATEGDNLILVVDNNCQDISDVDMANNNLNFYRENYGNVKAMRTIVQAEGGTGFFKIWHSLQIDLEIDHHICLGYVNSTTFSVRVEMVDAKRILK